MEPPMPTEREGPPLDPPERWRIVVEIPAGRRNAVYEAVGDDGRVLSVEAVGWPK